MSWTTDVDVPDYTVRVYTDQIVTIKSSTDDVGSYNYAIDKKNGTVSTSAPVYTANSTCIPPFPVV